MGKIGRNKPCSCGSGRKYKRCHGAVVSNSPMQLSMTRQEHWQFQYRFKRYLEHLSKKDLVQRGKDILHNMTLLTNELKIGFHPVGEEGFYWWERFAHLLEECSLRGVSLNAILPKEENDNPFPNFEIQGLENAVSEFLRLDLQSGEYLVKYGKYKYLEAMLKNGSIRIMPASSYFDPSLNTAIRDNELETSILIPPNEVKFQDIYKNIKVSVGGKEGNLEDFAELVGNWKYTIVSNTDFYVYCLAFEYSHRMFGDFEADCCLVITNPTIFLNKVLEKFSEVMPHFSASYRPVRYYDPLNVGKNELPFYFSKDFGYSYQKEYRLVWIPPEKTMELKPVFLELGSLEDCCEIIRLEAV